MGDNGLTEVLQFRPDFRVETIGTDVVFLIGENDRFVLSGRHSATVAGLIDGQRSVREIMNTTPDPLQQSEILYTIRRLKTGGYIVPTARDISVAGAAFWQGIGFDIQNVEKRLSSVSVSVHSLGGISSAALIESLKRAGLNVSDPGDMVMVLTDDYLRPECARINAAALENHRPWCMVKPVGMTLYIGPVFTPTAGPCWECLAHRLRSNRPVERFVGVYRKNEAGFGLPPISTPSGYAAACELASNAAALILAGRPENHPLHASLFSLNPTTFESTRHTVVRRPQCPACGDPHLMTAQGERPITLEPVDKCAGSEGGYRIQTPWQTFETYAHHI
ncbi:MAG: TOMM precursor leader peptide-binding protein, partial [Desulfatitalea sp.]|nr:TOMM precursor leader peptide-binding protein [Desulfatitalea sp.]NNK01938.1 TOMM precursor leader peptide-binding protein [Desulfatitalea sp.]